MTKVISIFLTLTISIGLGYMWRVFHEKNYSRPALTREEVLEEILHEAKSGFTFYYCGFKVIPLKDGRVVVSGKR